MDIVNAIGDEMEVSDAEKIEEEEVKESLVVSEAENESILERVFFLKGKREILRSIIIGDKVGPFET